MPQPAILTVVSDGHTVHCMTEGLIDTWLLNLTAERKAELFEAAHAEDDLSEHFEIERQLAFDQANDIINTNLYYASPNSLEWYELAQPDMQSAQQVAEAIQYLDTRGLIERDPEHPTWIAIRNEDEAISPTVMAELLSLPLAADYVLPAAVRTPHPLPVEPHAEVGRDDSLAERTGVIERSHDRGHVIPSFAGHGETIAKKAVDALTQKGVLA